jgi:hypothetical protein
MQRSVAVAAVPTNFPNLKNAVALFMKDSCIRNKLREVDGYMSSMLVPSRLAVVSQTVGDEGMVGLTGCT